MDCENHDLCDSVKEYGCLEYLAFYYHNFFAIVYHINGIKYIHGQVDIWNFSSSVLLNVKRVRCQVEHERTNSISPSDYM